MEENCTVALPISLNCWKHHAGFIKKQINSIKDIKDIDNLKTLLFKVGESQMDLYLGSYTPTEISQQVVDCLSQKEIILLEIYNKWLTENRNDFQRLTLKDASIWILRRGINVKRYIHIHPGRHSPNTVRVKATTLKTAILILCFMQVGEIELIEIETINEIRNKYLNEPPLKSFSTASGLGRITNLLSKKL